MKCPILKNIKNRSICNIYNNSKSLDLNKISIHSITSKSICENKSAGNNWNIVTNKYFQYKELSKTTIICNIKKISEGSYGYVYMLADKNKKYLFAVKTYYNQNDNEFSIIKMLKRKKIDCNLINSRIISYDKKKITIMNLMDGTLLEIAKYFTIQNIVTITKQLADTLYYFLNIKLNYFDLKAENIFFKCVNKNTFKIVFGDIGSFCELGKTGVMTWVPWEFRKNKAVMHICNEQSAIVWSLGVVVLELLNLTDSEIMPAFHWRTIETAGKNKLQEKKIKKKIEMLIKKYSTVFPLLEEMLQFDPKKRITLQNISMRLS